MTPIAQPDDSYDILVVGSSFSAAFFLKRYLERNPGNYRVLVLEKGKLRDHAWQVERRLPSDLSPHHYYNRTGDHAFRWVFSIGFGGCSNCWVGNTPRFLPNDMRLKSLYGVGRDWPLSYEELEPYYVQTEALMQIAGPTAPYWPQSKAYPQPAHNISDADQAMVRASPEYHVPVPTARASRDTDTRPACCANAVCTVCPIGAKFTVLNGMMGPFEDPRVSVLLEADVQSIDMAAGRARGLVFRHNGREKQVRGDLVVLAANGIFNPTIMLRSGLERPHLGRNLHCQLAFTAEVFLDGLDHFNGGSILGCHNFSQYDGAFRRERGSMVIETYNVGRLRRETGRWRQVLPLFMKVEDIPQAENRVLPISADQEKPVSQFNGFSPYALRTYEKAEELLAETFAPLPVERIEVSGILDRSTHVHGTTVMGNDPADSVLDRDSVDHRLRNLVVLGASGFPNGGQVNPTLTLSSMALRTADRLSASQA
ncbi:MAG: GMC family oxidoreductase [Pseudomonadota bacterium]